VEKPERNRPVENRMRMWEKYKVCVASLYRSTAALSLSHRKPFSTGTGCDTRGAQNVNKRNAL